MLLFLLFLSFDKLVAVVGTKGISRQEVGYLSSLYPNINEEELLDKMIMGRVVVNVAMEETLVVSDEEVNNAKINILQGMPGLQSLLSNPYVDSLYNEELRIQIYTRRLIQSKFQSRIHISPTSVRDFYESHKDSLTFPSTATLERLDVPVLLDEENRLLKLAKEIISEYRRGSDFATLVKKYSDDPGTKYIGGKLGFFNPEDLPQFLLGVLQISEGDVDMFESPRGYHIVRVKRSDIQGVELEHIFLQFDFKEEEMTTALRRIKEVRERWQRGDSTLNERIVSMGIIPIRAMGYPISAVVDTLDEGEISKPMLEGGSFHLLRVVEKREGGIPPFSEVKENISNILQQREADKALQSWFERIKEKVYIKKL